MSICKKIDNYREKLVSLKINLNGSTKLKKLKIYMLYLMKDIMEDYFIILKKELIMVLLD